MEEVEEDGIIDDDVTGGVVPIDELLEIDFTTSDEVDTSIDVIIAPDDVEKLDVLTASVVITVKDEIQEKYMKIIKCIVNSTFR